MRFVVVFGVVSLFADFVYEGARSVVGPFLATLGASAGFVGVISGVGEAVALVLRLGTGAFTDRTHRHWTLSAAGYAINVIAVPLLALAGTLWQASVLVIAERFGKAVRTPARDTMLSQAASAMGRGRGFAIHEALDQTGGLAGPLVVAGMLALTASYRASFAVLAAPAVVMLVVLVRLRLAAPRPAAYEPADELPAEGAQSGSLWRQSPRFWLYAAFTALTILGYATFAVLSYHLAVRHVVAAPDVPLIYAVAAAASIPAALLSGRAYDRVGLRGLAVLPVLTAAIPFLSFSTSAVLVWIGGAVWGAAMGVHESTMRAAVADLVPGHRRATGYGLFTAVYGLAWLAGSSAIGALYGVSIAAATIFTLVAEGLALAVFVPLAVRGTR